MKYERCLTLHRHMDYFNDVLTIFLGLERVIDIDVPLSLLIICVREIKRSSKTENKKNFIHHLCQLERNSAETG